MALLLHAVSSATELTTVQCEQLETLGLWCYISSPLNGLATFCKAASIEPVNNEILIAYSQRVEAARAITDIIPMRYGNLFDDSDKLHETLAYHREHFIMQLQKISGCVEMSVRAQTTSSAVVETSVPISGREYLKSKQQQVYQWRTTFEVITQSVAGHYIKSKVDKDSSESLLIIHFLVRRTQVEQFEAGIHLIKLPRLLLSGPWAPYNFVN